MLVRLPEITSFVRICSVHKKTRKQFGFRRCKPPLAHLRQVRSRECPLLIFVPSDPMQLARLRNKFALCCTVTNLLHLYTVSQKNVPTLASCSFDKHGLILIIFGKQHQHIFKNDMLIRRSLSLHFYLFYILLNTCDGNDAKQRVFRCRLLVALKRAGSVVCWL